MRGTRRYSTSGELGRVVQENPGELFLRVAGKFLFLTGLPDSGSPPPEPIRGLPRTANSSSSVSGGGPPGSRWKFLDSFREEQFIQGYSRVGVPPATERRSSPGAADLSRRFLSLEGVEAAAFESNRRRFPGGIDSAPSGSTGKLRGESKSDRIRTRSDPWQKTLCMPPGNGVVFRKYPLTEELRGFRRIIPKNGRDFPGNSGLPDKLRLSAALGTIRKRSRLVDK